MWNEAQTRLGAPIGSPGSPEILGLDTAHQAYLEGVLTSPRYGETVGSLPASFQLVEIEPLLAFQFHVYSERSEDLCNSFSNPPEINELLGTCLPHTLEAIPFKHDLRPNGIIIESDTPNLRLFGGGIPGNDALAHLLVAAFVGAATPLVQVVRFNGRCYLRNGFHRVYGARVAGATHIPCIFMEASGWGDVVGGGGTFSQALLESDNPPTLGHYTQGRAHQLRRMRRVISVNWAEHAFLESD